MSRVTNREMKSGVQLCFLCGLPGADTVEHVVSRGFFPDGLPPDPPKAAAHRECNGATKREEEALRNVIAIATRREGNDGDRKLFDTALRALKRPEAARYREDFMRRMRELPDGSGSIGMPEGHAVYALVKMCKGLAFLGHGHLIPSFVRWGARTISFETLREMGTILPPLEHTANVPPVLEAAWWCTPESPFFGFVHFFGRIVYVVNAIHPKRVLTVKAWRGKLLHWPRR